MSVFDSIIKRIHGTQAENGTPDNPINVGGIYVANASVFSSGISAGKVGNFRMTQQRELVIVQNGRTDQFDNSKVESGSDIRGSVTNWYASDLWPLTTAFFNGADAGFDGNPRYIQIPMQRFSRGALIGFLNNLGGSISITLDLWATIGSVTDSISINRVQLDSVVLAAGTYAYFLPYPNAAGAGLTNRYVPQLLIPCTYLNLIITPSGNPSSGDIRLAVAR
jgi:hypothetical protein